MVKMEDKFHKNENIPWRLIDAEAILVDIKEGESIYLNEVGTFIWNSLDGKNTVKEIVECICDNFDIDLETAKRDTIKFLETLLEKKLISCEENS
jgi:methyltransferase-like protein